jgi:hypothetical protein
MCDLDVDPDLENFLMNGGEDEHDTSSGDEVEHDTSADYKHGDSSADSDGEEEREVRSVGLVAVDEIATNDNVPPTLTGNPTALYQQQ